MIQTWRGLLLVAVLTLMIGLVVLFPARIAYRWASPDDVVLSGIQGTLWYGSAESASAGGVVLRDVRWISRPWNLLTGRLVYRIEALPAAGFIEGDLFISIGSSITLSGSEIRSSLPLQVLESVLNLPGLRGNASLQLQRLEVRDGMPVELDGSVDIDGLLIPAVNRTPIGGYRAEFFTQADGISGSVEDTDGVVDIAGSLQLNNDRSYRFLAVVMAKPTTPRAMQDRLRTLPQADDPDKRELRIEGSL